MDVAVPYYSDEAGFSQRVSEKIILDVLDLKQMDILDVLKLMSKKSGLNIVAGQNVKGRISIYVEKMDVEDALEIIVDSYGWAYEREGNIVRVMTSQDYENKYGHKFGEDFETRVKQLSFANTADLLAVLNQVKSRSGRVVADDKSNTIILMDTPQKLDEMEMIISKIDVSKKTVIFDLSYGKAEDVANKISELLTPNVGVVKHDERSNKIAVSDTSVKLKDISQLVKAFDQQDKEVLIEAKILQILLNDEHKMGIDWEGIIHDFHDFHLKSDFGILSDSDKGGRLSVGTVDDDNKTFLIEALKSMGLTNNLSSPRITAVNNKEAKILIGSTEPYVTTTTTTPSSGPTTTAETVSFIEVGVKLYVTPTIHNDGFITMKIKPEVSSVVDNLTTSNNNTIPIVDTSEAETTVMVKDGATIVIGGLIKEEKIKAEKQVPVLGNVPILGYLFKSKTDSVQKNEIVIFLTPRIISGDVEGREETRASSKPPLRQNSVNRRGRILEPVTSRRNLASPAPQTGVMANPAYRNYSQVIRQMISQRAHFNVNRQMIEPGEVRLSFILASNGRLKQASVVEDKTSASTRLQSIGLKSLQESAPFPPFPKGLNYSTLSFNVVLSFD